MLEQLVRAGIHAPSGDNTQPWRFRIDAEAARIALYVDSNRDPSPMNSGNRMARIAVGAALENIVRTAEKNGLPVEFEQPLPPALATVRVTTNVSAVLIPDEILRRVTNRRVYDGRLLPSGVVAQLEQLTRPIANVRSCWITDRARIPSIASLIARADRMMFGEASMRRAFLGKIRFDRSADAGPAEEGLTPASLEMTTFEGFALRLLPSLPSWFLGLTGGLRAFAVKARTLAESASGFCLVTVPDASEQADVHAGRAVQRAWLALTERELAVQPMMSLLVLENVRDNGSPALVAKLGHAKLAGLLDEFRDLMPEIGSSRPAFLMRFGYAPPPTGRCGRMPVAPLVSERS
jgi:hypothetical protein